VFSLLRQAARDTFLRQNGSLQSSYFPLLTEKVDFLSVFFRQHNLLKPGFEMQGRKVLGFTHVWQCYWIGWIGCMSSSVC